MYGNSEVPNRQNHPLGLVYVFHNRAEQYVWLLLAAGTAERMLKLASSRLRNPTPDCWSWCTPVGWLLTVADESWFTPVGWLLTVADESWFTPVGWLLTVADESWFTPVGWLLTVADESWFTPVSWLLTVADES